jgi:histidine triad (HIT) family protein
VLVVTKKHISTSNDITEEDEKIVGKLSTAAAKIAHERGIEGSGYRTVMNCNSDSGQMVFHIHMHMLGGRKLTWPPG